MLALTVSITDGAMRRFFRAWDARSFVHPLLYQTLTVFRPVFLLSALIDVALNHMLNLDADRAVLISFLEDFTGKKISKVMSANEALPTHKRDADEKQTFLDLACREPDGHIFLAEVQVRKQNYWDARV